MPDIPGRPKLILLELDPRGIVLELRCWSEEEAINLFERMELRGRGFALSYWNAAGEWLCSKEEKR